jgi:hypothetical protein
VSLASRPSSGQIIQEEEGRFSMDVRTMVMLTPLCIFLGSAVVWFWTNKL